MEVFWLMMGIVLTIVVTYLVISDGFSKWGFYYIFVALVFIVWFIRMKMRKHMEKHMEFLEQKAREEQSK